MLTAPVFLSSACIIAAQDKTRILVTHALHFLPQVDYIYTMIDGRIGEHGTYADLMAAEGDFARFVNEFGSKENELEKEEEAVEGEKEDNTKDEKAVAAWRTLAEHRIAQARGRGGMFAGYRLRVAEVLRDYGLNDRAQVPDDPA